MGGGRAVLVNKYLTLQIHTQTHTNTHLGIDMYIYTCVGVGVERTISRCNTVYTQWSQLDSHGWFCKCKLATCPKCFFSLSLSLFSLFMVLSDFKWIGPEDGWVGSVAVLAC